MTDPSRYPVEALHGPMTAEVVNRCIETLSRASLRTDVFMKIGSSDTVSANFLACFAGTGVQLDAHDALEPTRAWFRQTSADGSSSSFARQSRAAGAGWLTSRPLAGSPTPVALEIAAIRPAFAVMMMGTEDTHPDRVHVFERDLRRLIDALLVAGVVPVVSTIPPRADQLTYDAMVPEMNAVIRALAQARQMPYVDFWRLLSPLPDRGLTSDGIHLNVFRSGGQARPCRLRPDELLFGMNQRNLVTLEALDRVRRFLIVGESPEPAPPTLAGSGTWDDPRVVDQLPFVDDGDTRLGVSVADFYGSAPQNESGPEIVYRIDVGEPTTLRARVFCDDGVDVDLHWMDAPDPASCTARADRTLNVVAQPGTYFLSADTFVSSGQPKAGPYRLTVLAIP